MKKAAIIYNSKTGTTKQYAEEIGAYLISQNLEVTTLSIQEYNAEILDHIDYLLLGCWTSGLMFFLQHPEKAWNDFAAGLPDPLQPKTALFTTYKIRTGSMFKKMRKQLNTHIDSCFTELKSRNSMLSGSDQTVLDQFIQ
jgi:flavodoxin